LNVLAGDDEVPAGLVDLERPLAVPLAPVQARADEDVDPRAGNARFRIAREFLDDRRALGFREPVVEIDADERIVGGEDVADAVAFEGLDGSKCVLEGRPGRWVNRTCRSPICAPRRTRSRRASSAD